MGEGSDQTALQRRATWVGLRTLRQRPKVVGETRHGELVFEVRSVRLVLRDEAGHFSRLAECSKCGREIPGAPVMTPADLDRPAHSVICKDCVRASVAASPLQPERRPAKSEPPPPPPAAGPKPAARAPAPPVDDVRLAAMEAQLQSAVARLAELADAGGAGAAESRLQEALRAGLAEIRADLATSIEARLAALADVPPDQSAEDRLRGAMGEGLAQIRADVMAAQEAAARRAGSGAGEARKDVEALTQIVHAQQSRLVSLSAVLDETRGELQRLAEANGELARAQADLERGREEGAGRPGAPELAGRERRLRGDVFTLTEAVQTLRAELESSLGSPVRDGLAMVVQAVRELARARDEVRTDVDGLVAGAGVAQARMDAFVSALEDGDGRLRDLELRMQASIDGLTGALEAHRRELEAAEAAGAGPRRLDRLDRGGTAPPTVPGELLDGLERQLQEAEGRLAQLTAGRNGGGTPAPDGEQGRTA